jgi:hypothetical protein
VNPYIVVDGAERLIDFLVEVFGGVEQGRSLRPDGRIEHGDPPPTVPAWPRAQPRSWPLPIDPGAIVAAASSTHSTTGDGSRPISEPLLTTTSVLSATGRCRITRQADPQLLTIPSALERLISRLQAQP